MAIKKLSGILGLLAILLFGSAFLLFGWLNPEFNYLQDYVSKLGAKNEPYSISWNIFGFFLVGMNLTGFGLTYGKVLNDRLAGILLALFGVGFAFTAIPIDMDNAETALSKTHVLAITLGLACWLIGLSRIGYNSSDETGVKRRANITAILLVVSMVGFPLGFWSMPVTHRLVFIIVFGWTVITSLDLLIRIHSLEDQV